MGLFFSRLLTLLQSAKPCRILMVGLDAAGKTTLLYKLKLGDVVTTIPTIGFNVETVDYANIHFTVWDIGGQFKLRALWRHYFENTQGLIYVVDSNDPERFPEAKEELMAVLEDDSLPNCPVLVLANKQDLPGAEKCDKLAKALGLSETKDRPWFIQATCATNGDGIYEGLDWLASKIK